MRGEGARLPANGANYTARFVIMHRSGTGNREDLGSFCSCTETADLSLTSVIPQWVCVMSDSAIWRKSNRTMLRRV